MMENVCSVNKNGCPSEFHMITLKRNGLLIITIKNNRNIVWFVIIQLKLSWALGWFMQLKYCKGLIISVSV